MQTAPCRWHGLPAVQLTGGGYTAVVLPEFGANCISLRHDASGAQLLRESPNADVLRANPNVYGLPLLFPPNRIRDGQFTFEGQCYQLPINEPARHHHIHGTLSVTPFTEEGSGVFRAVCPTGSYLGLPFAFTAERRYVLDAQGLHLTLTFRNDGTQAMPMGTGLHAALTLPQLPGDPAAAYRLQIPVRRQWCFDPVTIMPTLATCEDSPLLTALRDGTLVCEGQALSILLECAPGDIVLSGPHSETVCRYDAAFPFVMLWNGGGTQGFVCPEPQSWLVDAPNLPLPPNVSGMRSLVPGASAVYQVQYSYREK